MNVPNDAPRLRFFPIRHHGIGFSRALVDVLLEYQPDCLVVEGAPELASAAKYVGDPGLVPPVAMHCYAKDDPASCALYPFASFSPEFIAMRYAQKTNSPIEFFDLPFALHLKFMDVQDVRDAQRRADLAARTLEEAQDAANARVVEPTLGETVLRDPLYLMMKLGAYQDPDDFDERCLEQTDELAELPDAMFEALTFSRAVVTEDRRRHAGDASELYADLSVWLGNAYVDKEQEKRAIAEELYRAHCMRSGVAACLYELAREAYMRRGMRRALASGAKRILVVCGAWHSPAIDVDTENEIRKNLLPDQKADDELIAFLGKPDREIESTWSIYSYAHIDAKSAYAAGISWPGWYESLWIASDEAKRFEKFCFGPNAFPRAAIVDRFDDDDPENDLRTRKEREEDEIEALRQRCEVEDPVAHFITRAIRCLRAKTNLSASPADAIDATRFAYSLAAQRGHKTPNQYDALEALTIDVVRDNEEAFKLIQDQLIVGEALGKVPASVPTTPLRQDFDALRKKYRFPELREKWERRTIDLKTEFGREQSAFLYRLKLLDVDWAVHASTNVNIREQATSEEWKFQWFPGTDLALVAASLYGATVEEGAEGIVLKKSGEIKTIDKASELLCAVVRAKLSDAAFEEMHRLVDKCLAKASDVVELMQAIVWVAEIVKFSDVRRSNVAALEPILSRLFNELISRLPGACVSIKTEAAERILDLLEQCCGFLKYAVSPMDLERFFSVLVLIDETPQTNKLISGRIARILFNEKAYTQEDLLRRLRFNLSNESQLSDAADWLYGLLHGVGTYLAHMTALWETFYAWLSQLTNKQFDAAYVQLRKVFAGHSTTQRRDVAQTLYRLSAQAHPDDPEAQKELGKLEEAQPTSGPSDQGSIDLPDDEF